MNIWENFNFDNPQKITTNQMIKQDLMHIKDFYTKVNKYFEDIIKDHSHIKLSTLIEEYEYSGELRDFQDIYNWYHSVNTFTNEEREILFGDKKLQISEISQLMTNILKDREIEGDIDDGDDEEEYYGGYDSCGHASPEGWSDVYNFFNNLDEDRLIAVTTGAVESDYEVDIDGGRSYFMSGSNIYLYCFNYLYYTMGVDADKYDDMIYNSGSASEHISDFYVNTKYELPLIEKLENWYQIKFKKKYQKTFDNYNSLLSNIIRQFSGNPLLDDMIIKLNECVATDDYIEAKVRDIKLDKLGVK